MQNRITWTQNTGIGRSGWNGSIDGKRLFTIEMSVHRGKGWQLWTRLPLTVREDLTTSQDSDRLKDLAETLLVIFVSRLGAVFPETPES